MVGDLTEGSRHLMSSNTNCDRDENTDYPNSYRKDNPHYPFETAIKTIIETVNAVK